MFGTKKATEDEVLRELDEVKDEVRDFTRIKEALGELSDMADSLKELGDVTVEDIELVDLVKETLEKHDIRYQYDPRYSKRIMASFGIENKSFLVTFTVQSEKVIMQVNFPFRVQCSSIPIVALYIAEFNKNKAFSLINLDPDDGELSISYSTLCKDIHCYNHTEMWIYIFALLKAGRDTYTRLNRLSVGVVPKKMRDWYLPLYENSVKVLKGEEEEEENIEYGVEKFKKSCLKDKSDSDAPDSSSEEVFEKIKDLFGEDISTDGEESDDSIQEMVDMFQVGEE